MSVGTIILIILVIALLGGFSGIGGGPFYGTGYYGGGGLGLVIVILLILLLLGKILTPAWKAGDFAAASAMTNSAVNLASAEYLIGRPALLSNTSITQLD